MGFLRFQNFPKNMPWITVKPQAKHTETSTGQMAGTRENAEKCAAATAGTWNEKEQMGNLPEADHERRSVMAYNKAALQMHEENKGKIGVVSKVPVKTRDDLSTAYTPGVAEPCRRIRDDKNEVYRYTAKGNLVAVVSDGTAVLGLGDIGPEAAMPVMEESAVTR